MNKYVLRIGWKRTQENFIKIHHLLHLVMVKELCFDIFVFLYIFRVYFFMFSSVFCCMYLYIQDCVGKQLAMKEMRIILGYLLINYRFKVEDKYMKMVRIPYKGGVRAGICKPVPQIPLIIEQI